MLNNVRDKTPPCGTLQCCLSFDSVLLYWNACLSLFYTAFFELVIRHEMFVGVCVYVDCIKYLANV